LGTITRLPPLTPTQAVSRSDGNRSVSPDCRSWQTAKNSPAAARSSYGVVRSAYAVGMWDVLTWHDGTLAIAWWAVIVLIVALLSIGGTAAARRK